jgi:hypothetical protein
MSVAELQRTIAKLPPEQQRTVARFVTRLRKGTSAARQRQLSRAMREMDAGKKFTREDVRKARAATKARP